MIPYELILRMRSPQFWKYYFWFEDFPFDDTREGNSVETDDDDRETDDAEDTNYWWVDLKIEHACGLRLGVCKEFCYYPLKFLDGTENQDELAWDDQAHWHPHLLRWEELDTLCKYWSIEGGIEHPGFLLLLLMRFAPICKGDNIQMIAALVESAFSLVDGATPKIIQESIERIDARKDRFEWRSSHVGWVLEQQEDPTLSRGLYTLRRECNTSFPFARWHEMIETANRRVLSLSSVAKQSAERFSITGDIAIAPTLAQSLEQDFPSLSNTLRQNPTLAPCCWISEEILGVPRGSISQRFLSHETLPRTIHALQLEIGYSGLIHKVPSQFSQVYCGTLDAILQSKNEGSASMSGATSKKDDSGEYVEIESTLRVSACGAIENGIRQIRNTLWWSRSPETVRLGRSYAYELPLNLESDIEEPNFVSVFELCRPVVFRWRGGYRIDRQPFDIEERETFRSMLTSNEFFETEENGWYQLKFHDRGSCDVYFPSEKEQKVLVSIVFEVSSISNDSISFLFNLLDRWKLAIMPMFLYTNDEIPKSLDVPWPIPTKLHSVDELKSILTHGAKNWWTQPN